MKYLLYLGILALSSCAGNGTDYESHSIIIGSVEEKYKVIDVDPPKHFHVTLQNLRTNRIYHDIGRRKHCNSWRSGPKVWDVITITTIQHRDTLKNLTWDEPSELDILDLYCQ